MKKFLIWFLAIVITLGAAVFQKLTGPTYPKRVKISIDQTQYKLKLIRSHGGDDDATVELNIADQDIKATLFYRKYPTNDEFSEVPFARDGEKLVAKLPHQPPAGKLEYYIKIYENNKEHWIAKDKPIVIRFKGAVPAYILIPHIFFMFLAMFFSNLTGFMAIFRQEKFKLYGVITLITLTIGGMFLGPVVQKFAFGEYWTGIPFGWDLTDNKTLIAFVFWIAAVVINRKRTSYAASILAFIVLLLIYSIPHSMFGSELNPETGEMTQGIIFGVLSLF